MSACSNIDVSKEQTNTILQAIHSMLVGNYSPHTIVSYVCSEMGLPQINDTNYCLVTCVSSCVNRYAVYNIATVSYTYNTVATTYACINTCFPTFPTSSCSGSGSSSSGRGCSGNAKSCKGKQKANMDTLKGSCLNSLNNQMMECFTNISLTCSSYAMYICMLAEHLTEITLADITKKIGAAIDWIAKIWKSIKDMTNSVINWAKTVGESDIAGHFHKALQDALTTLQGYLTDIMKNIGQYIEQIGEFLYDLADRMWDLKDIAFDMLALSSMINDIYIVVNNIVNRQTKTVSNCNGCKSQLDTLYDAQFSYTDAMDIGIRASAAASEVGLNNLNNPQVDIFIAIPNSNIATGVSIS